MKTRQGGQFGELAPRSAMAVPWQEVHVDTIGKWHLKLRGGRKDPVTNLLEIEIMKDKTAKSTAMAFELAWLCRYPRPVRCVHDNGPEYNGHDFQFFLEQAGIKSVPVTTYNPQSNGICEHIHQTVAQVLRVFALDAENSNSHPTNADEAKEVLRRALAQVTFATCCIAHGSLNNVSPGAVVLHRDMYLDLPFVADLLSLQQMRQGQIDTRLLGASAQRRSYDWKIGDKVWLRNDQVAVGKLRTPWFGPHTIKQVHTNGTVTLQQDNGIVERVNIRRIKHLVAATPTQQLS